MRKCLGRNPQMHAPGNDGTLVAAQALRDVGVRVSAEKPVFGGSPAPAFRISNRNSLQQPSRANSFHGAAQTLGDKFVRPGAEEFFFRRFQGLAASRSLGPEMPRSCLCCLTASRVRPSFSAILSSMSVPSSAISSSVQWRKTGGTGGSAGECARLSPKDKNDSVFSRWRNRVRAQQALLVLGPFAR